MSSTAGLFETGTCGSGCAHCDGSRCAHPDRKVRDEWYSFQIHVSVDCPWYKEKGSKDDSDNRKAEEGQDRHEDEGSEAGDVEAPRHHA